MAIGLGIILLIVGLILLLGAVDLPASVDSVVQTELLGWILTIAGALALVLSLVLNAQRSRTHTRVERRDM